MRGTRSERRHALHLAVEQHKNSLEVGVGSLELNYSSVNVYHMVIPQRTINLIQKKKKKKKKCNVRVEAANTAEIAVLPSTPKVSSEPTVDDEADETECL